MYTCEMFDRRMTTRNFRLTNLQERMTTKNYAKANEEAGTTKIMENA